MAFSSCGSRALERSLSSRGARAYLLHGMWDLPGPGIEPVSPALAGRFLTTVPPGKPPCSVLLGSLYTCSLLSVKKGEFRKLSARDLTKARDKSFSLLQDGQLPVDFAK